MVAPMLMPRGGVGVAGLGGYLYAVGGNDGAASLQSVERYNPHTNKWSRVASMNRRRAGGTESLSILLLHCKVPLVLAIHSTSCLKPTYG